jgi:hypothetical protein
VLENVTDITHSENSIGGDLNDASSMVVEPSEPGTPTEEEPSISDEELRQAPVDSETLDVHPPPSKVSDYSHQRLLHKSISFGTGAAGGVASESLLKSLTHASFDNMAANQGLVHSHELVSTLQHSTSAVNETAFSDTPEELELHRRLSTSSQIADKFGDMEDIPGAVKAEERRSSHVQLFEERESPVEDVFVRPPGEIQNIFTCDDVADMEISTKSVEHELRQETLVSQV